MSAKHKRPFYAFAAVAVVCVVMLGIRSSAHDGGQRHPVPMASDGASQPQAGAEIGRQTHHGRGHGKGQRQADHTVFTFGFLTPAAQQAVVQASAHVPLIGSPTLWHLPSFAGDDDDVPDPAGDVRDVRGHDSEDPSDPPEQPTQPSTDPPSSDGTQGPETPEPTPESEPTESEDPASGQDDFDDPSATGQSGDDSSAPSSPPAGG